MTSHTQTGFSLIELVVVILLISILAVSAGAKLLPSNTFQSTTDRDQTIALLRTVQARAMYNTQINNSGLGMCYQVAFTASQMGMLARNADGTCNASFAISSGQQQDYLRFTPESSFTVTNLSKNSPATAISFDNLGRPIPAERYQIIFNSDRALCVESQGYIHAC